MIPSPYVRYLPNGQSSGPVNFHHSVHLVSHVEMAPENMATTKCNLIFKLNPPCSLFINKVSS